MQPLKILPLNGIPEIMPGSNLVEILAEALRKIELCQDDILVVTHKIVSKAYGYVRDMKEIIPTPEANRVAVLTNKDPRQVQVIMDCSNRLYACDRGIVMVERPDGWICANAGVDASNAGGKERLILLPEHCDAYAKSISLGLWETLGIRLAVIICDTHGRALRNGATGVCVGSYGVAPMRYYRGQADRDGRHLQHTEEAVADEIASAATLLMGQGSEGVPAAVLQGYTYQFTPTDSFALKRSSENCLYKIEGAKYIVEPRDEKVNA